MSTLPAYISLTDSVNTALPKSITVLNPDKVVCLVDENTRKHCLPNLDYSFDEIIQIKSGESHKHLKTCSDIWKGLTDAGCSRKSLLVNLGGGVIGDMGGFCAATFKRGIAFINIPTTLLAQVDASIGGKLGIDFHGLKNHIGVFKEPDKVIIDPSFLNTLKERELRSGFAEVVKHALIYDAEHWNYLRSKSLQAVKFEKIIPKSISIKNDVVVADPLERGLRKILNFGHTLGHAMESYYMESTCPLLHGEAIAIGMILEGNLSMQLGNLTESEYLEIKKYLLSIYPNLPEKLPKLKKLQKLLHQDKKNEKGMINYSLLSAVGQCGFDIQVESRLIENALSTY